MLDGQTFLFWFSFLFIKTYFYLKGGVMEKENPQMLQQLGLGRPQQEPGTLLSSPVWFTGPQTSGLSFAAFPGTLAENWNGS